MYVGYGLKALPSSTIGFVDLDALFGIVLSSIFIAPIGVKLSHRLPGIILKRVFGCIIYIV